MKIYVTTNLKLCPVGTIAFPPVTMYPHTIREALRAYLDEDDDQPVEETRETCLATLNRTVLDQVQHEEMDGARITYADVFIETEGGLVPLLDLHDADWLAQGKLGTLFDHHAIHWLPNPPATLCGTALSFEVGRNIGLRQGQEAVNAPCTTQPDTHAAYAREYPGIQDAVIAVQPDRDAPSAFHVGKNRLSHDKKPDTPPLELRMHATNPTIPIIEWIPLDQQLPLDQCYVLLTGSSGMTSTSHFIVIGQRNHAYRPPIDGKIRWLDVTNTPLSDSGFEPTYWAPLPNLPDLARRDAKAEAERRLLAELLRKHPDMATPVDVTGQWPTKSAP